jgi:hypothetical protein
MGVSLIFLASVIASYWAVTDPVRLRQMAQVYLSDLVGGKVSVGTATLSLLQGLHLSNVTVWVDGSDAPDSKVFEADAIDIGYDPTSLLRGRLEATRIVATKPRVNLVESTETGRWNVQRLRPKRHPEPSGRRPSGGPAPEIPLPQVVVRDARIDYGELSDHRLVPRGSMDVEGRVFPSADAARYLFELQSRGAIEGVGPVVTGQVQLKGATAGQLDATLAHFRFGRDIEAMLPREVRSFWQAHHLQGAVDIPEFRYTPALLGSHGKLARRESFDLRIRLQHVRLVVQPEEMDPPAKGATRPAEPRPPIPVDDVTGEYRFNPDGVRFHSVRGTLLGNTFLVTGTLGGYSPDVPMHLRLETPPDAPLVLPPRLPYLASLPRAVREVYGQLRPSGTGHMWVEIARPSPSVDPVITGRLTVTDGQFKCVWFPYPLRNAAGTVQVGPDPQRGFTRIDLVGIHGRGLPGGPNADREMTLDGWVGPLDMRIGCGLHATGRSITGEPALFDAFDPQVRKGLAVLQGPAGEPVPSVRTDFDCHIDMPVGLGTTCTVTADLHLLDGAGRLAAFPYPLEHLTGDIHVGDGYVDLHDVGLRRGDATVNVAGRVTWASARTTGDAGPDLRLSARNIPLDDALLTVLPPAARTLVRKGGVTGQIDVDGRVLSAAPDAVTLAPASPTSSPAAVAPLALDVSYDLGVSLHHASARPLGGGVTLTGLTAQLGVHPDRLDVLQVRGRRGTADLSATGTIDFPAHGPTGVHLSASAHGLALDPPVRDLLPAAARSAWDAVAPRGAIDADLTYAATGTDRPDYRVTIRPRDLTVLPAALPYRLDHVVGAVTVDPRCVTLTDVRGTHGGATVAVTGYGLIDRPDCWDLKSLSTRDMPIDGDLRRALPPAIRSVVAQTRFRGKLDLDLHDFRYRGGTGSAPADVDLTGSARAVGGSMDIGVPLSHVDGGVTFAVAVRDGHVAAFRGDLDLDTVSLVARPLQHLRAHVEQPSGTNGLRLTDIRGEVAGGRLAGSVNLRFSAADGSATSKPSDGGYAVEFSVTDADMATLAGSAVPGGKPIRGRLSASLSMQGDWSDPATRRGRGVVVAGGRDMYQIPLVLGLLEVTDLSLPSSAPFSQATANYVVDGQRVTFEQLQMRGDNLVMDGTGWLDFGSKRVRMNFTTDNPRMAGIPILHDVWQGAKQELLQIQVRGTVQDPQVSAASLHTFTTTVDEVFSGPEGER